MQVPSPAEASKSERIYAIADVDAGFLPFRIEGIQHMADSLDDLDRLIAQHPGDKYVIRLRQRRTGQFKLQSSLHLCMAVRSDASSEDLLMGVLAACCARQRLLDLSQQRAGPGSKMQGRRRGNYGDESLDAPTALLEGGAMTVQARDCIAAAVKDATRRMKVYGSVMEKKNWTLLPLQLAKCERVRYSVNV